MTITAKILRVLVAAAIAVVLLPAPALADGFGWGAKGGFTYSNLSFSSASDLTNAKSGWMAGVFFGGKRPVDLMAEINFLDQNFTDTATGAKTSLHYLDIPVMLKINIGSTHANGVSFYVFGGPGFDFKIGDTIASVAQVQNFENFNFNLVGGAGLELTRFIIEGRGMWGLKNIAVNQLAAGDLHTRTFALLFGIRFN